MEPSVFGRWHRPTAPAPLPPVLTHPWRAVPGPPPPGRSGSCSWPWHRAPNFPRRGVLWLRGPSRGAPGVRVRAHRGGDTSARFQLRSEPGTPGARLRGAEIRVDPRRGHPDLQVGAARSEQAGRNDAERSARLIPLAPASTRDLGLGGGQGGGQEAGRGAPQSRLLRGALLARALCRHPQPRAP